MIFTCWLLVWMLLDLMALLRDKSVLFSYHPSPLYSLRSFVGMGDKKTVLKRQVFHPWALMYSSSSAKDSSFS